MASARELEREPLGGRSESAPPREVIPREQDPHVAIPTTLAARGTPLVSVVVPVHRTHIALLEACLDSVSAQTAAESCELVVVDDASGRSYAKALDRVLSRFDGAVALRRVALARRARPGGARAAGFEASTGRYVHFLDSDDLLAPEMIEKVTPLLQAGCAMAFTDEARVSDKRAEGDQRARQAGLYGASSGVRWDAVRPARPRNLRRARAVRTPGRARGHRRSSHRRRVRRRDGHADPDRRDRRAGGPRACPGDALHVPPQPAEPRASARRVEADRALHRADRAGGRATPRHRRGARGAARPREAVRHHPLRAVRRERPAAPGAVRRLRGAEPALARGDRADAAS